MENFSNFYVMLHKNSYVSLRADCLVHYALDIIQIFSHFSHFSLTSNYEGKTKHYHCCSARYNKKILIYTLCILYEHIRILQKKNHKILS